MKTNKKFVSNLTTHGGGKADTITPLEELKRTVLTCLLFEDSFYESGVDIASRIDELCKQVKKNDFIDLMLKAKNEFYLRHVPLWMAVSLTKNHKGKDVSDAIYNVINRADEPAEILSLYWKNGKCPISKQLKLAIARVFENKFTEYHFAKYNRDYSIKLRDVMFLTHPKPGNSEREDLFKRIINDELTPADTWENAISKCKTDGEKRIQWERLLTEKKLPALALLRNLRNMREVDVDKSLVENALMNTNFSKVFPFRFVSAAKNAPYWESMIDEAMLSHLSKYTKLPGKTVIIVDVSGSMYGGAVSGKSDMDRALVACAVGAIGRELCENVSVYATAGSDLRRIHQTKLVPDRRGMALVDAIYSMCRPLGGGGIFLNQVCEYVKKQEGTSDRTIVITDEQDCSGDRDYASKAEPLGQGYIINVASYVLGIGYSKWTHIHGFSEAVFKYIIEAETMNENN